MFKKVVNVRLSDQPVRRPMITGIHRIRYVYCKKCDFEIGWTYEYAEKNINQQYKEGKILD